MMIRKRLESRVVFWHQGENGNGPRADIRLGDPVKYKSEKRNNNPEGLLIRIINKTQKIPRNLFWDCPGEPEQAGITRNPYVKPKEMSSQQE